MSLVLYMSANYSFVNVILLLIKYHITQGLRSGVGGVIELCRARTYGVI
jgi:hypothetical protein